MKVSLKYKNSIIKPKDVETIHKFLVFLQSQVPLKSDILVYFTDKREGQMTTGIRMPHGELTVLVKNRLLIDVLRTLAHEWVHEFQHQKLGVKDFEVVKDIGGQVENMANTLAGIFMKKFVKEYPEAEKTLYQED